MLPNAGVLLAKIRDTGQTKPAAHSRGLDHRKLFRLSAEVYRLLPDPRDRETLSKRTRNFLYTRRRGRLRLPRRFPKEIQDLTKLSKTQLRTRLYYIKPGSAVRQRIKSSLAEHTHQVIPGGIWNRKSAADFHTANVVGTCRLHKSDWPRITGRQWPSTPTISELLEMSRRGVTHHGLTKALHTVENHVKRSQVSDDIRLARKIVTNNIVGVRSSIEVRSHWLKYFRYREGFLILTVRHAIPPALVRFLLGRWIKCPTSLWLVDNCRFKYYLKKHTVEDFLGLRQQLEPSTVSVSSFCSEVGSLSEYSDSVSEPGYASSDDEEFNNFLRSLPN
jgi:hypothetical protein